MSNNVNGVNPLWSNEYYFLSAMYDDTLITEFFRKVSAETHSRAIRYQNNYVGHVRSLPEKAVLFKFPANYLSRDDDFNRSNGLPAGSRYIRLTGFNLPIHDTKKFIDEYGVKEQKIPLIDFITRTDIFDKWIDIEFGRFHLTNGTIMRTSSRETYLVFSNEFSPFGFTEEAFTKILKEYTGYEIMWMHFKPQVQAYSSRSTANGAISSNIEEGEYYRVAISSSSALNHIDRNIADANTNSWECFISEDPKTFGPGAMISCPCVIKAVNGNDSDSSVVYDFLVPKQFIDYVVKEKHTLVFYLTFMNTPNRRQLITFTYDGETHIDLDYKENPAAPLTTDIYEYDVKNFIKLRRLDIGDGDEWQERVMPEYFPNILNIEKLNPYKKDLCFEISEFMPSHTNESMRNSLSPLMNSLGDQWLKYVTEGYDTVCTGKDDQVDNIIQNFHPTDYPISVEDYLNSPYFGNIRGYILDKLEKIMETDPWVIAEYYRFIIDKNKKMYSASGSPKEFKFNCGDAISDDIDGADEFRGSNKIVMDASIATGFGEFVETFTEPHSYITFTSNQKECPSSLYIGGRYFKPTCTKFHKGLNYLFFPTRMMVSAISEYMKGMLDSQRIRYMKPITLDFYPGAKPSIYTATKDECHIESMDDVLDIFKGEDDISINDIIAIDKQTGEYIDFKGSFTIDLELDQVKVENPFITDTIVAIRGEQVKYLLTELREVYCTSDGEPIILEKTKTTVSVSDAIDKIANMVDKGQIPSFNETRTALLSKPLPRDKVTIKPKLDTLVGRTIQFVMRNYKMEASMSPIDALRTGPGYYFEFKGLSLDTSEDRYVVYYNGRKLNPKKKQYMILLSKTYAGSLEIYLTDMSLVKDPYTDRLTVVHMPIQTNNMEWYYEPSKEPTCSNVRYMVEAGKIKFDAFPDAERNLDGIFSQYRDYKSVGAVCTAKEYDDRAFTNSALPLESDNSNMWFTHAGLRMPPVRKATNRFFSRYYSAVQCGFFELPGHTNGVGGHMATISYGLPFFLRGGLAYKQFTVGKRFKNPLEYFFRNIDSDIAKWEEWLTGGSENENPDKMLYTNKDEAYRTGDLEAIEVPEK